MAKTKDIKLRLLIETVDKASQGVKAVSKQVDGLSTQLKKAETSATNLAAVGTKLIAVGATMLAAFVFPVKSAAGFEKAMSRVRAVTEGATENFEALNQKASELGGITEFTAKQVAEGMAFLGQAGFDAGQVIEAMSAVVDLATAGQLELAQAADIASNVLQGMQLDVSQLGSVMDTLAVTATNSNTNIQQMGEALKFAAPAAAAAGISLEKTAAIIGVLGNNGIQACYDNETDVLTKDGFKKWKDITDKDIFATVNQKTKEIEYQKSTKLYKGQYKGKMYVVKNRHLDLKVTPNHSMYVRKHGKINYELIKAENIIKNKNTHYLEVKYKEGEHKHVFQLNDVSAKGCEKWVDYNGMIYCAEVPNHTLIVRRNGKIIVCGNSLAGTALRGMLASLVDPSNNAQEALDRLGVTVAVSADGSIDLVETLRDLGEANLTIADAFTIFRRRGASAALALTKQISAVDELIIKNEEGSGSLKNMATIMRDNLTGAITVVLSAFDRLKRSFGSSLLTPLKVAVLTIAGFLDVIATAAEKVPFLTSAILGLIGAFGVFAIVVGTANLAMKALTISIIANTVASLKNPYVAVAAAVIGTVVAIYSYIEAQTTAIETTKKLNKEAQDLSKTFGDSISKINNAQEALDKYAKGTKASLDAQNKLEFATTNLLTKLDAQIEKIEDSKGWFSELTESEIELIEVSKQLKLQIDNVNGGFLDGGAAAKEFNFQLKVAALKTFRKELIQTAKRFSEFTQGDFSVEIDLKEIPPEKLARVRAQANALAKQLERAGFIDFGKSTESLEEFIEEVGLGGTAAEALRESFAKLSIEFKEIKKVETTIVSLTKEFEKQKDRIKEIALETIKLQDIRSKGRLDVETKVKLVELQKEETIAIKETRKALQEKSDFQVDVAEKIGKKATAAQRELLAQGVIDAHQASIEIFRIEVETAQKIKQIRKDIAGEARVTFDIDSSAILAFENQSKQSLQAVEEARRDHFNRMSKLDKEAGDKRIAEVEKLRNAHIRNLSVIESAFKSTFSRIGSVVKSAIDKQIRDISTIVVNIKAAENDLADTEKSNAAALLELTDSRLSKDKQRIVQAKRFFEEVERLSFAFTGVGVSKESIENAKLLQKEMEVARDKLVEIGKAGDKKLFEKALPLVESLNQQMVFIGQNIKDSLVDQQEDANEKLEEYRKKLEEIQRLSSIRIDLTNIEETKTKLDNMIAGLKKLGIDIDPEVLQKLRDKIGNTLEKEYEVQIKLDEQKVKAEADKVRDIFEKVMEKEMQIRVKAIISISEGKRFGGLMQKFNMGGLAKMLAFGGRLSGYGGGDKIKALLEQGEFVVRKEAVRRYGTAFMNAINSMQFSGGDKRFQTGGSVGQGRGSLDTVNLNFNLGRETVRLQGESGEVKRLITLLRREGLTAL